MSGKSTFQRSSKESLSPLGSGIFRHLSRDFGKESWMHSIISATSIGIRLKPMKIWLRFPKLARQIGQDGASFSQCFRHCRTTECSCSRTSVLFDAHHGVLTTNQRGATCHMVI